MTASTTPTTPPARRLRGLRLRSRLSLSFAAVLLLLLALGMLAAAQLKASHRVTEAINDRWLPSVRWTLDLRSQMNEFRTHEFEHILAADDAERKPRETRMDALAADIAKVQATYGALVAPGEQTARWQRLSAAWRDYLVEHAKIRKLAQKDQADTARALIRAKSEQLFNTTMAELGALVAAGVRESDAATAQSRSGHVQALTVMASGIGIALALGFGLAWWLGRSIATPLADAVRVAEAVAAGDLRVNLDTDRSDEIGDLFAALRTMSAGLSGVVNEVRSGVETLAFASTEIVAGTQDLSVRTVQQADQLQQATATLDRLSQTAAQNASVTHEASQLASSAHDVAVDGGRLVNTVVERMSDIAQSSKRIAEITGVIDAIAFQTNILALNAAVEAARAGEQGRGFAVVASEVRVLAQRSSQAAKEIRNLIGDSVEKVDAGSGLANDAGRTMQDVLRHVQRLSQLVGDISTTSAGQRDGIAGVNRVVAVLDQSTHQNAAMVQQSAAASASLNQQAERLTQAVAVFQV